MSYETFALQANPLAYWLANESSGIILTDLVGGIVATDNGTSGDVTTYSATAFPFAGTTTLEFASSWQNISLTAGFNFNPGTVLPRGNAPFTVEVWFRYYDAHSKTVNTNLNKFWDVLCGWGASVTNGNYIAFGTSTINSGPGAIFTPSISYSLSGFDATTWHHVVSTHDGSTQALYLDGVSVGSASGGLSLASGTFGTLGAWHLIDGSILPFPRSVSHVAVYGFAFTASQVASHYVCGTSGDSYGARLRFENPVSYWTLGESSGTTIHDVVGPNNGTASGSVTLGQTAFTYAGGTGITFPFANATNGIALSSTTGLPTGASPYSVEAWAKFNTGNTQETTSVGATLVTWGSTTANALKYLTNNSTTQQLAAPGLTQTQAVSAAWHHIVSTYDGTTTRLYLDGVAIASTGAYTPATAGAGGGVLGVGSGSTTYVDFTLAHVAVYAYALSSQTVSRHYTAGTLGVDGTLASLAFTATSTVLFDSYSRVARFDNPIAFWKLDETAGTTVHDSISAANGTLSGSTTLGISSFPRSSDTAIRFNTYATPTQFFSYQGVTIPSSGFPSGHAVFSLELWFRCPGGLPTASQANRVSLFATGGLVTDSNGSPNLLGLFVAAHASTYTISANNATFASSAPMDTAWHHLVSTYDGTTTTLYMDNVVVATDTSSYLLNPAAVAYMFAGNTGNTQTVPFAIELADVAVYNYALSPSQIFNHFQAILNGFLLSGMTLASAGTVDAISAFRLRFPPVTLTDLTLSRVRLQGTVIPVWPYRQVVTGHV